MNYKHSVLITGASSGIGYDAALTLAKKDYRVFAGVRNKQAQEKIQSESKNIQPLILDVTNQDQIQRAFELVSQMVKGESFSLINNAGIAIPSPVETLDVLDFKKQFDVNFFGLISVTQKFLPLIRKNKGRVINISSVSGLTSTPFLGAYSASKYALEALSDSLRWELASSGVKVVLIEPGPVLTSIWEKGLKTETQIINSVPAELKGYYSQSIDCFSRLVKEEMQSAISVKKVSHAILKSLEAKNPPLRVVVASRAAKLQLLMGRILPQRMMDKAVHSALFKTK